MKNIPLFQRHADPQWPVWKTALFWVWNLFWGLCAALGIGLVSLVFAAVIDQKAMLLSYFQNPLIAFLNLAPVVLLYFLLYFLLGRAWLSYALTAAITLGLIVRYRAFERSSEQALVSAYATCFSGFEGVARLGCVVMAAGAGERFGGAPGEKLTAPLAGVPVLERTLRALPDDLLDVVVVSAHPAVAELCSRLGVRCVEPDGPLKGQTMSAGLAALGGRAGCLFVTGDQPLLTRGSVRRLVGALAREPRSIVRLAWRGRPGAPVLWPHDLLGALAHIEGDAGGTALLAGHAELSSRVRLVEAADEWELADVDTAEDLERLEAALLGREETA